MRVIASCPGSIMISGEHAVVYGYPAIVAAIEQRISVVIESREDNRILVHSALGEYQSKTDQLTQNHQLRFVIACLASIKKRRGMTITITSEMDPTLGLGTSAAITIAMLGALSKFYQCSTLPNNLHHRALKIIRDLQNRGSGADLAASLWGGMISYQIKEVAEVTPLPLPKEKISLSNCGYKTPTAEVLAMLAAKMKENPDYYQNLYASMGEVCTNTILAARNNQWADFYLGLNRYQTLMDALGVCDIKLASMITAAKVHLDMAASKISGSGLGDCIVTFSQTLPANHQEITIAKQGLLLHD